MVQIMILTMSKYFCSLYYLPVIITAWKGNNGSFKGDIMSAEWKLNSRIITPKPLSAKRPQFCAWPLKLETSILRPHPTDYFSYLWASTFRLKRTVFSTAENEQGSLFSVTNANVLFSSSIFYWRCTFEYYWKGRQTMYELEQRWILHIHSCKGVFAKKKFWKNGRGRVHQEPFKFFCTCFISVVELVDKA